MRYVVDTNFILDNPEQLDSYAIVITSAVLRELEDLERKKGDTRLQYQVRQAKRALEKDRDNVVFANTDYQEFKQSSYSKTYVDNILLEFAKENGYGILTNDLLLGFKARAANLEVIGSHGKDKPDYTGVQDFYFDNTNKTCQDIMEAIQMSVYAGPNEIANPLDMKRNEYLIVWDKNQPTYKMDEFGTQVKTGYKELGTYKFNGHRLKRTEFNDLKSKHLGKISPRNTRQRLAFDLLQNDEITVKFLAGVYGSGKDFLMLSHALELVEQQKFDRIVWVRNNIEVKDTNSIGFLPDSLESKLKPFLAPLQDFLGGEDGLDMFISNGKVEVQHLGFIRGRDIKNSIIYVTEVQSNTREHIQLLLGRVGEGTQIWFNGDDQQTDSPKLEANNGVTALKRLAGEALYGQVTMDKTERSETARLAALLDLID